MDRHLGTINVSESQIRLNHQNTDPSLQVSGEKEIKDRENGKEKNDSVLHNAKYIVSAQQMLAFRQGLHFQL